MNKTLIGVILVFVVFLIAFFIISDKGVTTNSSQITSTIKPDEKNISLPIKASFLIYTNGTKRDFSDPRYHNKSDKVYIEPSAPTIVVVKKENIKWADLFATLPMQLTDNCITTGTGQNFCDKMGGNLKFYINNKQITDFLSLEIKDGDKALISFGDENKDQLDNQLSQIPSP